MNHRLLHHRASRPTAIFMTAFGTVLLALPGCSGDSRRQAIEGTVTIDGQPLEQGDIVFLPEKGTKGPTAGGEISAGRFSIPAKGGTFAGWFRVEITASRPAAYKVRGRVSGQLATAIEQYLPACYNAESTLRVEVREGHKDPLVFALRLPEKRERPSH